MYEPRCRRCFEPQLANEKVEAEKKTSQPERAMGKAAN